MDDELQEILNTYNDEHHDEYEGEYVIENEKIVVDTDYLYAYY